MTIGFRAQGVTPSAATTGTGTTTVAPALPAGLTNTDLVLIYVGNKPDTATPTTPAGWALVGTVAGGGGTGGADTGPARITVFSREKDASWSTMPTITVTGANGSWAQAFGYSTTVGAGWDVASTSGADITSGTGWSVTGAANPGIVAGDWVGVGVNTNSDASAWSAEAITATGISVWGTTVERSEPKTTQGNDMGGYITDVPVTTGTASAAPVAVATASIASTGVGIIVRFRENVPKSTTDGGSLAVSETTAMTAVPNSGGPVVPDVTSTATTTTGTTMNWSHTVGSGSNRLLLVMVTLGARGGAGTSGTVGVTAVKGGVDTAMTSLQKLGTGVSGGNFGFEEVFYIRDPDVGSNTIKTTRTGGSGTQDLRGSGFTYTGAITPIVGSTAAGTGNAASVTFSVTSGEVALCFCAAGNDIPSGSDTTLVYQGVGNDDGAEWQRVTQRLGASGSISMTDVVNGDDWGSIGVRVPPVAVTTPSDTGSLAVSETSNVTVVPNPPMPKYIGVVKKGTTATALTDTMPALAVGDIVVVKGAAENAATAIVGVSGVAVPTLTGVTTFTRWVQAPLLSSNEPYGAIWTGPVTSTQSAGNTLSAMVTAGSGFKSMVVEVWDGALWILDATPVSIGVNGAGTPSQNITTEAANSAVTYLISDWAAVAGTPTHGANATAEGFDQDGVATHYCSYFAYIGDAGAIGTETISMSNPTGQDYGAFALEIKALTGSTPITGSESNSLAIAETNTLDASSSRTDTGSISIAETSSILVTLSATDTGSIATGDVSSSASTLSAFDTGSLAVSENSALVVTVTASDTGSIATSEVANVGSTLPGTESIAVGVGEQANLLVTVSATDSLGIGATDASVVTVILATTDTGSIATSESVATTNSFASTDTGSIVVSEVKVLDVNLGATDTGSIAVSETTSSLRTIPTSDTSSLAVTESSNVDQLTFVPGTDTGALGVTEQAIILVTVSTTDTGSLAVSESQISSSTLSTTDTGSIAVSESKTIAVSLSTSDTGSIVVNEVSNIATGLPGTETIPLQATEQSSVAGTVAASDTGSISVSESTAILVTLSTSDTGSISASESTTFARSIDITDTTALGVTETATILVTLSATDTGGIAVGDSGAVLYNAPGSDTMSLAVSESTGIVIGGGADIFGTDIGSLAVSETTSTTVGITGVEYLPLAVTESTSTSVTGAASDTGSISVSETKTLDTSSGRTDAGALAVTEASAIAVTLASTDATSVGVTESVVLTPIVPGSDNIAISVSETSDIQISGSTNKTASDSAVIGITETASVAITLSRTDTIGISVTEQLSVAGTVTTDDTLPLAVTENVIVDKPVLTTDTFSIGVIETSQVIITDGLVQMSSADTLTIDIIDYSRIWDVDGVNVPISFASESDTDIISSTDITVEIRIESTKERNIRIE